MNKKEIVETFLRKDYLVSPDFFDSFNEDEEIIDNLPHKNNILVITKDVLLILKDDNKTSELNWLEFEKSRAVFEKGKDVNIYYSFLDIINYNVDHKVRENLNKISEEITKPETEVILEKEKKVTNVTVIKSYVEEENKKREVGSFIKYFHSRYNALKDILSKRVELQNAISINKISNKGTRDLVVLIGIIQDKQLTKNGHILVNLEDPTGVVKILFPKNKEFVFDMAQDLVLDEVIGVVGVNGGEIIFADGVYLPDIPITKEIKKCNDDVCVVFISDIHVGSNNFLEKEFLSFISWLNCDSEDNELAKKVKYIFVVGDVVDGIGVYPGQEQNLTIKDVTKQYEKLATYLKMIRKDVHLILCPGDHDAVRLSHPQPPLNKKYAENLYDIKNLTLVTNPSFVNIHSSSDFSGFNVLMYHGHGYHYYIDNVDSLRKNSAAKNPHHLMKFFLQRRHLAPSHSSTIYVPDSREDHLVIDKIPDIFISGHLHKTDIAAYRNVITINCGCWQSVTDYELKVGNFPDPCKVPILNLMTGNIIMKDFSLKNG